MTVQTPWAELAAAAAALAAVDYLMMPPGADRLSFAVASAIPFAVAAGFIIGRLRRFHPHPEFGVANGVTLVRLVLICPLAGLLVQLLESAPLSTTDIWRFTAIALAALALDSVDGWLARRQGLTSRFGARFDMEVDAFAILLLASIAVLLGKAGLWLILAGLMRYIFDWAGSFWPKLRQPLPQSWRRKAVCVVQVAALIALMTPVLVPPVSTLVGAVALGLLIYSFAADVAWLMRRPMAA